MNWISVNDNYPDQDGYYLGYCENGMIECQFEKDTKRFTVVHFEAFGCGCCAGDDEITHWMLRPPQPKL
jgi:hypothetical protein